MKSVISRIKCAMGLLSCMAGLGVWVGAGSVAVAADGSLEEIIVTATKRDESLQTVPIAITALTSEALENMGAVNFEDFARTVPGLDFANLGAGQNRVTIRGISTFSGVSVIGIYLDDSPIASPINYTQPSLSLYDLERIEVLRGPQGTLYGRRARWAAPSGTSPTRPSSTRSTPTSTRRCPARRTTAPLLAPGR